MFSRVGGGYNVGGMIGCLGADDDRVDTGIGQEFVKIRLKVDLKRICQGFSPLLLVIPGGDQPAVFIKICIRDR